MKVKTGRYVIEVMTERMAELEEEIAGLEKQLKEKNQEYAQIVQFLETHEV